jgi:hypothetical protein
MKISKEKFAIIVIIIAFILSNILSNLNELRP